MKSKRSRRPRACGRCGSQLTDGLCNDDTCPFSEHRQTCPVGWVNHPHAAHCRDNVCNCGGWIEPDCRPGWPGLRPKSGPLE